MSSIQLEKREKTGKQAKQILNDGFVPAVLYDRTGNSTSVQVNKVEAEKIIGASSTSSVIDMSFDGRKLKALIKEVASDPLTDVLRHVAFFEIDENRMMTFDIPVNLVGIAPAVKNNLGVLIQPTKSILVKCKYAALVPSIDVEISGLEQPGQGITLADIKLPDGIELVHKDEGSKALATIGQLQELVIEEPTAEATPEGEAGAEAAPAEAAEGTEAKE